MGRPSRWALVLGVHLVGRAGRGRKARAVKDDLLCSGVWEGTWKDVLKAGFCCRTPYTLVSWEFWKQLLAELVEHARQG